MSNSPSRNKVLGVHCLRLIKSLAGLGLLLAAGAVAASPWAEVGDRALRDDIEVLYARGLISGPITTWPLPVGFLVPLQNEARMKDQPEFIRMAARRVLNKLGGRNRVTGLKAAGEVRVTGEPNLIRDFGNHARDELDVRAGLDYEGDRFASELRLGHLSQLDGEGGRFTPDGSYVTALFGNVQVYGGWVEKWYGPGYVSSLILSNNARPIPKIGWTRNSPEPFKTKWLSWLGPFQIDFNVGLLNDRQRVADNTGLGTLRFAFIPVKGLEVAITRSVEFCGSGLDCSPFEAAILINNTDADRNASNDEATIEFKYTKDFNVLSVSPYVQFLNEDTGPFTHSFTSYLTGVHWAGPLGNDGKLWGLTAEYTDSRSTLDFFGFDDFRAGYAYNNSEYVDGFRYRGRTIGFSLDSDSVLFSVLGSVTDTAGRSYRLAFHNAHISTGALSYAPQFPFYVNTVSSQPAIINQVEAGVSIPWRGFTLDLEARWQDGTPFPDRGTEINVEAGLSYRF